MTFFNGPTETDVIINNLNINAPMGIDKIVYNAVKDWLKSHQLAWMIIGEQYYKDHPDIKKRRKMAIGPDGNMIEVTNVANNKLHHNFTKKLIDQKVGYLLSKPITAQADDETYEEILSKDYFDKNFMRLIQRIGKESIQKGIAWLHPYYDEQGQFKLKRMPANEIIPLWRDSDHTELESVIRVYQYITYEAEERKEITRVEHWTKDGVMRLVYEKDRVVPDASYGANWCSPHAKLVNPDKKEIPHNWNKVPFVCFKYNDEELPLIHQIKSLIDDYDKQKSDNSNALEDAPNSIFVLKNLDGQDLGEFRRNLSVYRAVKVTDDGGVDTKDINLNTDAYKAHQDQNRRDIYEFGRGVDSQSDILGNDKSGKALKFVYADLDLDCNMIETEYQWSLEQLLFFINTDILNRYRKDYSNEEVTFIFNRDIIINETEAIENAAKSKGVISDETIVANHPWTTNVQEELDRIQQEQTDSYTDYPDLNSPDPQVTNDEVR
ncbi:SPP1 family phage portal protein [Paenibacillus turicensis]|uniref:SPP1 family phage portal protein n=1 Tax=Paenibacillus turicensis TaxID=160487 RepID=A0ABS4FW54_9BACL|nr:phage portal protein [Paenibacillus turicensis]MBP1906816.1 SPP1 family phage portal protein [Paenibacillus turicensis]